jgi:hypothetical protein
MEASKLLNFFLQLLWLFVSLQLLLVILLLLWRTVNSFAQRRFQVAVAKESSKEVEPPLEWLVPLPPPSDALLWAVEWDLDVRAMINDLKSQGPEIAERYYGNEAFMSKLTKLMRNVVSRGELQRLTSELITRAHIELRTKMFHNMCKTDEEENEDARAWAQMMREMTGQAPIGTSMEIDTGRHLQSSISRSSTSSETEDAKAWKQMMKEISGQSPSGTSTDMGREKHYYERTAEPTQLQLPDDDAAAWEEMLKVMNNKPPAFADTVESPQVEIQPATQPFIGDDALSWEQMLKVMNNRPPASSLAETALQEADTSAAHSSPDFSSDDASAWAEMSRPMKDDLTTNSVTAESRRSHEPSRPHSLVGDDAAAWEAMLQEMNSRSADIPIARIKTDYGMDLADIAQPDAWRHMGDASMMAQGNLQSLNTSDELEEEFEDIWETLVFNLAKPLCCPDAFGAAPFDFTMHMSLA